MKITKYFTQFSRSYTVNLREERLGEISISQHVKMGTNLTDWETPYINWAGCGSQSVESAEKFIKGLQVATRLVYCLNNNVDEMNVKMILAAQENVSVETCEF